MAESEKEHAQYLAQIIGLRCIIQKLKIQGELNKYTCERGN